MDNANIEHPYPVTSIGAVDFMKKEIPPRELILAPWLPVQGLVLIYAKRGIGKTYFGINSAYAIATGREYLGWQAPKKTVGLIHRWRNARSGNAGTI